MILKSDNCLHNKIFKYIKKKTKTKQKQKHHFFGTAAFLMVQLSHSYMTTGK